MVRIRVSREYNAVGLALIVDRRQCDSVQFCLRRNLNLNVNINLTLNPDRHLNQILTRELKPQP